MKCPNCQITNIETARFCHECGAALFNMCANCGAELKPGDKFCGYCGQKSAAPQIGDDAPALIRGERKHVTVLFSDLTGYTAMTEKLDPEEVKEIMSRFFGEIAQVVAKYEGYIERFIGDAVMVIFGVPKVHEDDAVRAIKAARDIHALVERASPLFEKKVGHKLSMHSGINTGLAVTGDISGEKGEHGITGDTINMASRLEGIAKPGEILVGPNTHQLAEGYFSFEALDPLKIKGKAETVQAYKVVSPLQRPTKIHRLNGLRADLIGRTSEMAQMKSAFDHLQNGNGSIFLICGPAGTGKSRLVEEFKKSINLDAVQWLEGHAYPFAQNIPYFPLLDLLNRTFHLEEDDPADTVKDKIEAGISQLTGHKEEVPYLGSLYSLNYHEIADVSPDTWKRRLREAVQSILLAFAQRKPTVICLEDLHWADPSFLELIRFILLQLSVPALFICVYRPVISLFTESELEKIADLLQVETLQDLSPVESETMVKSLLNTDAIPSELSRFIQARVEGNPFYLEEIINSLIESEALQQDDDVWKLKSPIRDIEISSTINGIISARVDRLEPEMKRILQEASVIGRSFPSEILKQISAYDDHVDSCLKNLEKLDLVRIKPLQPEREYVFKHALTHEVVYNGLLIKERQEIHEKIGNVIETHFQQRLTEFFETLAFHFKRGKSLVKAIDYLMQSGKKSLKKYAVEESYQHYSEAYELILGNPGLMEAQEGMLINLLNEWAPVFYYRGTFRELEKLLTGHLTLAETIDNREMRGMFYVWLGIGLWGREKFGDSYQYLRKALELGNEIDSKGVIGYASAMLTWLCFELGFLKEALAHADRARQNSAHFEADYYPYYQSWDSDAFTYWAEGDIDKILELSRNLTDYGENNFNTRGLMWGHFVEGLAHQATGDFSASIQANNRALDVSADPFYSQFPKLFLGMSHLYNRDYKRAKEQLEDVIHFAGQAGCELIGTPAQLFLSVITIAEGHFSQGLKILQNTKQWWLQNHARWRYTFSELILGEIYLSIVRREAPLKLDTVVRNFGFILKTVPFAGRKAEEHYNNAVESAKMMGAKGLLGQAYLGLGLLNIHRRKKKNAVECLSMAMKLFEQCKANVFLSKVKEALSSLE